MTSEKIVYDRLGIPPWVRMGRYHYARVDGGPVEVSKNFTRGFPYIQDPAAVMACCNIYNQQTIEWLKAAGINWIWVTFSVGFSHQAETVQRDILRKFIADCRRQNIHVDGYISITKIQREEMLATVPDSKNWVQRWPDGHFIPYPPQSTNPDPGLLLACLNNPNWFQYQCQRIEAGIEAGLEGFFWDNHFQLCSCQICRDKFKNYLAEHLDASLRPEEIDFDSMPVLDKATFFNPISDKDDQAAAETTESSHTGQIENLFRDFGWATMREFIGNLYEFARGLNPDILFSCNAHQRPCGNEQCNVLFTEDGFEPGFDKDGRLVTNIGLYKFLQNESRGIKPICVETGKRIKSPESLNRMDGPLCPASAELAVYEAAAMQAAAQMFTEGGFSTALYHNEPEAFEVIDAFGRANRFIDRHPECFGEVVPVSDTILTMAEYDYDLLNAISVENLDYLIYSPDRLTDGIPPETHLLILHGVELAPLSALIQDFKKRDGKVITIQTEPAEGVHFADPVVEDGRLISEFVVAWEKNLPRPMVKVSPSGLIGFSLVRSINSGRYVLNLLNYTPQPVSQLNIHLAIPRLKLKRPPQVISPDRVSVKLAGPDHVLVDNLRMYVALLL